MSKAELCPVCKGKGKLNIGLHDGECTCHGCNGKGWVEVGCDYPSIPIDPAPWYPVPYYPQPFTVPPSYPWGPVTYSFLMTCGAGSTKGTTD